MKRIGLVVAVAVLAAVGTVYGQEREGWKNDPALTGYVFWSKADGLSIGKKPTARGADEIHAMSAAEYLFKPSGRNWGRPAIPIKYDARKHFVGNPAFEVRCGSKRSDPPMHYSFYAVLKALDDKNDPSCAIHFSTNYSKPSYNQPSALKGRLWFDKDGRLRVEVFKLYKRDGWLD